MHCFCVAPPVIEVQSDEKGLITKQHNDNLTLFCVVSGCRTPNVTWLKNGVPLERDKGFSVEEVWFGEIGRTFVNSTLTLSGLTLDDNGYYVCRAENTLAQVDLEEGYTLSVNGVPGEQYHLVDYTLVTLIFCRDSCDCRASCSEEQGS